MQLYNTYFDFVVSIKCYGLLLLTIDLYYIVLF